MLGHSRSTSLLILLSLLTSLAGSISMARADSKAQFDLPAELLDQSLRDFAAQAKFNISYEPAVVLGIQTPAIKGAFTTTEVLSLLLKGTRLHAVNINKNTIQVLDRAIVTRPDAPSATAVRITYNGPDASSNPPASGSTAAVGTADAPPPQSANSSDHDSKELDEITVTGTNIRGVDNKTVPLMVFDRDAIERSGYSTTQDFIDSLPQNVKSGGNSADGVLTGNGLLNIENSTAANLRGLGSGSTLTLLNGHRVAPSSYGTGVDLSMIPLSAVERIEVLTDGSSAVYGADAVGGVVNIILRKDFNGQESSARFDTLTRGGGEQKEVGQSLGRTWDQGSWNKGGVLMVLQFLDSNPIHSDQRSFTVNLPPPTDIYPSSKRYSGVFSGHQSLPASTEIFADALVEHDDGFRAYTTGGASSQIQLLTNKTDSASANAGFRWLPVGDWHLEADTLFSQVNTQASGQFSPAQPGYTNGAPYLRNLSTIKEGDLRLDGTLWASGGASIKAAAGGSYRRENFSSLIEFTDTDRAVDRAVRAAYAEVYAPLISSANSIPWVRRLEFSAAVRRDSYSDFGAKTNPRFGVFWSPVDQIGLRAAYSTSFRAPNAYEVITALTSQYAFVEGGYPLPNGANGNVLFFGNQTLGPESSRNLSAGLDFQPISLPGTRLSLNYYRIKYTNRLIDSPIVQDSFTNTQAYGPLVKQFGSDAAVGAFVAGLEPPQTLLDFTPGGTGLTGVRYGFPYGLVNAAGEKTEGLDVGTHSIFALAGTNKLTVEFNATYIRDLATNFCGSCTTTDLVNTYGQPLKFRMRTGAGWSNGVFSANSALNFSNAYADTNVTPTGRISAFTTVDFNATYRLPVALATNIGFSVTNLFDSGPPTTAPALNRVAYDPSNADPRGRALSLIVRAQW